MRTFIDENNIDILRTSGIIKNPEISFYKGKGYCLFFAFAENDIDDLVLKPFVNLNHEPHYFSSEEEVISFCKKFDIILPTQKRSFKK
jgi:hypothetical protein